MLHGAALTELLHNHLVVNDRHCTLHVCNVWVCVCRGIPHALWTEAIDQEEEAPQHKYTHKTHTEQSVLHLYT